MEAVRAGADARTRLELALVKAASPALDGSLRALLSRIERLEAGAVEPRQRPAGAAGRPICVPRPRRRRDRSRSSAVRRRRAVSASPGAGPVAAAAAEPAPEPERAPESPRAHGLDGVLAQWPAVVDLVRGENALLGALLAEARPVAAEGEDLTVAFAATAQFLKKKAEDPANRMIVGEALQAVTGTRWRLSYELREEPDEDAGAAPEQTEEEWVRMFMEEFDAEELSGDWAALGDAEDSGRAVSSNEKGS